jgi:hypothetical protein
MSSAMLLLPSPHVEGLLGGNVRIRPGESNAKRIAKATTVIALKGARPIKGGKIHKSAAKTKVWINTARPDV